tara:strand:- start:158 stop:334 length:177 start_codon:yes stop_codon:yes gene_type:complete
MKETLKSVNIKNIKIILTKSIWLIKLGFIGFLSLLSWGLHLIGKGLDFINEQITKKGN